jgi:hypothetical protein
MPLHSSSAGEKAFFTAKTLRFSKHATPSTQRNEQLIAGNSNPTCMILHAIKK